MLQIQSKGKSENDAKVTKNHDGCAFVTFG
jgi:hypothetical protein